MAHHRGRHELDDLRDVAFAANMYLQTNLESDRAYLRGALDKLYRNKEANNGPLKIHR